MVGWLKEKCSPHPHFATFVPLFWLTQTIGYEVLATTSGPPSIKPSNVDLPVLHAHQTGVRSPGHPATFRLAKRLRATVPWHHRRCPKNSGHHAALPCCWRASF